MNLRFRLSRAAQQVRIGPPARESDGVDVMQLADFEACCTRQLADSGARIAAKMAEIAVNGAVQRGEGRRKKYDASARRQNRRDALNGSGVVINMFKHVQQHARIRPETREIAEGFAGCVESEGMNRGAARL